MSEHLEYCAVCWELLTTTKFGPLVVVSEHRRPGNEGKVCPGSFERPAVRGIKT